MSKRLKNGLLVLLISAAALAAQPKTITIAPIYADENPPQIQKADALDRWIDQLETFECEGCKPGYKRIDSNGKFSHGCLQFQDATFAGYSKQLALRDTKIGSCADQKRLAKAMILDDYSNWKHWYTSVVTRGLGKPPRIEP